MQTEIEAKFLHIDINDLRQRLTMIGASLVKPERIMRRATYDYPSHNLEKIAGWVRVRNEGNQITLTYKQLDARTLHGTKEVNLVIDSFDHAQAFLTCLGLTQVSSHETKRESWKLGTTQFEIDTWPWIDSFLEIEGQSEEAVRSATKQLGLSWDQAQFGSVEVAYMDEYNVTEAEVNAWPEIKFIPVPIELAAHKKSETTP